VIPLALLWACGSGGDDDDGDACFAAGTPVATPGGEVAIESLRPGDPVLSRDRQSGAIVTAIVTQTRRHPDRAYRLLELPGGRRLAVTDNHPIYDAARGDFVPAGRLSGGARLLTLRGLAAGVRVYGAGRGDVYDLSVTGDHVYFAAGVLVHNKTPDASPPKDAHACADASACQLWPGLPPDTVHGYLFEGCDTPDCCVEASDWWAAGTFAEQPVEGATATPLERAVPELDGAFEVTASDAARFLCAGEPLVNGDLAVVGACVALPAPHTRVDYLSGPGGGVWLTCGQF
jgi:hypothetical protein